MRVAMMALEDVATSSHKTQGKRHKLHIDGLVTSDGSVKLLLNAALRSHHQVSGSSSRWYHADESLLPSTYSNALASHTHSAG